MHVWARLTFFTVIHHIPLILLDRLLFAVMGSFIPAVRLKVAHVLHIRRYRALNGKVRSEEAMEGPGRQDQRAGLRQVVGKASQNPVTKLMGWKWAELFKAELIQGVGSNPD